MVSGGSQQHLQRGHWSWSLIQPGLSFRRDSSSESLPWAPWGWPLQSSGWDEGSLLSQTQRFRNDLVVLVDGSPVSRRKQLVQPPVAWGLASVLDGSTVSPFPDPEFTVLCYGQTRGRWGNVFTRNESYSQRGELWRSKLCVSLLQVSVETAWPTVVAFLQTGSLPSFCFPGLLMWRQLHPQSWMGQQGVGVCAHPCPPSALCALSTGVQSEPQVRSILSMAVTVEFPLTKPSSSVPSSRNQHKPHTQF